MQPTIPFAAPKELRRWLTADLVPDADQPRKQFDEVELADLGQSLISQGQLVPLLVFPHPTNDRQAVIADGERRWRAALATKIQELDVLLLPTKPNPAELLMAQLSVNQFRESLTPQEEYEAYRRLLVEAKLTQVELAAKLGVTPSKVCKVLSRERVAPGLLQQVNTLEATVVPLIARLPAAAQTEAVAFATTPTTTGRKPTRDEVQQYIDARKTKRPGPKPKWLTLAVAGRELRLTLRPDDTHDLLVEWLKAVQAFVLKAKNVPVQNLDLVSS